MRAILSSVNIFLIKCFIHSLGRLGTGISLTLRHGLTSGKVLDYIYKNNPSGWLLIGRWIDRFYLNHEGWESIRVRKRNIKILLKRAISDRLLDSNGASVLDIACGTASYMIETISEFKNKHVHTICRDMDVRWLEEAKKEADLQGLDIRFETGDALNREELLSSSPRPNVIVAAGIYEWITDDSIAKYSIRLLSETLQVGGCLVLTTQTWHTDMKMVTSVFPHFDHGPLRLSIRSSRTIHQWLEEAGFEVIDTLQDRWGFYAVDLARKWR